MLGFFPEASTRENLRYGERLLNECDHGSVHQLVDFWQDPNMYYAFESKSGAEWISDVGRGPKRFMKLVADSMPPKKERPAVPRPSCSVKCYSCGKHFESFTKPINFCIYRCMCTNQKVVHPKCFMNKACALCGTEYTVKKIQKKILKDL